MSFNFISVLFGGAYVGNYALLFGVLSGVLSGVCKSLATEPSGEGWGAGGVPLTLPAVGFAKGAAVGPPLRIHRLISKL